MKSFISDVASRRKTEGLNKIKHVQKPIEHKIIKLLQIARKHLSVESTICVKEQT